MVRVATVVMVVRVGELRECNQRHAGKNRESCDAFYALVMGFEFLRKYYELVHDGAEKYVLHQVYKQICDYEASVQPVASRDLSSVET